MLIAVGIALTTLFATIQQQNADLQQRLNFELLADAELAQIDDLVGDSLADFDDAVKFTRATFPGDAQSFERFFDDRESTAAAAETDPGVLIIEAFEADRIDELIDRERSSGNTDFDVVSLEDPGDTSYVITRSERQVFTPAFALQGFDLAPFTETSNLILPEDGRGFFVLDDADPLTTAFGIISPSGLLDAAVLVVEPIPIADGPARVWAARFLSPRATILAARDGGAQELNVAIRLADRQVDGNVDGDPAEIPFESAPLSRVRDVDTSGLEWQYLLWADDDLGIGTGLFDQGRAWLIGLLATALVAALALARVHQANTLERTNIELDHARMLASTDSLTGLHNRQGFLDAFAKLDDSGDGTLFFIDLDNFKDVNDLHGHRVGDDVLGRIAGILRGSFRRDDILSRFGGDEFVAYAPGVVDDAVITDLADRVINSVDGLDLAVHRPVSCSVGLATRRGGAPGILRLLEWADEAMYSAKADGGGRVYVR